MQNNHCMIEKKKKRKKIYTEAERRLELSRFTAEPHLADRTSVSESLACIKHKPVNLKKHWVGFTARQ